MQCAGDCGRCIVALQSTAVSVSVLVAECGRVGRLQVYSSVYVLVSPSLFYTCPLAIAVAAASHWLSSSHWIENIVTAA